MHRGAAARRSIRSGWCAVGVAVSGFALAEYVNDRPYVASSFLSVALVTVFKSAMAGTCKGHEELAGVGDSAGGLVCRWSRRGAARSWCGGCSSRSGYAVEVAPIALDSEFPEWGDEPICRPAAVGAAVGWPICSTHLYVLLPVLDDEKHYWVDEAEIEKLMRRGEGWLAAHPERDLIVRRYLKKQAQLFFPALEQLDESRPGESRTAEPEREPARGRVSLRDQRLGAVQSVLESVGRAAGARPGLRAGRAAGAADARAATS